MPAPLRIAILTNAFPPEFGAAPGRWMHTAQSLRQAGHRVVVYTAIPNYPKSQVFPEYRYRILAAESCQGLVVRRHWTCALPGGGKWARLAGMASLSASLALFSLPHLWRFRPHLLLVQYPPPALPLLAVPLSRLLGAKLAVNFSDLWPQAVQDLQALPIKSLSFKAMQWAERFTIRHAHAFLAQSEEIAGHLRGLADKPLLLYRTGVDAQAFAPASPQPLPPEQPLRLIYMGVMGLAHGLLDLCQHVDFAAQGCELHLYGDGHERPALAEWLAQHPGRGIFLHRAVPPQEVPQVMAQYDAALIPQRQHIRGTVPSKLYEAMAAGLPIVMQAGGEAARLLREADAGLCVPPQQYEALQKALGALRQAAWEQRIHWGRQARQAALRHYDRPRLAQRLAAWVASLFP